MRRLILAACVLALAAPLWSLRAQMEPAGLAELWTERGALRDTNGDGFADTGSLRIELGDPADEEQIAAAANLTARLGAETMSLDLPLRPDDGASVVYLGQAAPEFEVPEGLGDDEVGFVAGSVTDGVYVWSASDEGLRAATLWLAGRAPHVWGPDQGELSEAEQSIDEWLGEAAEAARPVAVAGLAVRAGVPGVDTIFVRTADGTVPSTPEDAEGPAIPGVGFVQWVGASATSSAIVSAGEAVESAEGGGGSGKEDFDLADLYTRRGLLGDSNGDQIPDRLDAVVTSAGVDAAAIATLTARLGLEAAGTRLPAAVAPAGLDTAPGGTRVIAGNGHPALAEPDLVLPELPSDDRGHIQVAREMFGDDAGILARGSEQGVDAAVRYLGETAPYLSRRGKDAPELSVVTEDMRRFLARRTAGGQVAAALDVLGGMLDELPDDASEVAALVAVDRVEPGLDSFLHEQFGEQVETIRVASREVATAPEIWRHSVELTPEATEVRQRVAGLLPQMGGRVVRVSALISEPIAIREALADELSDSIEAAGGRIDSVEVLPAYKQGFGWLEERVLPALRGHSIDAINIRYARNDPPPSWPYQAMNTPSRWLLELFPIDEILARELGIPVEAITFEEMDAGGEIYEVSAHAGGAVIHEESFSPALVERPYFDAYPAYERVRVTGGWLRIEADGVPLLDEHMPTDLERVWDVFQQDVLAKLQDYTLRLHDGEPQASYAPHFGQLTATVTLSEPERPLGIDKERIAPMEALHEEIYFGTLHFFDLLGRVASGTSLPYPGRVIPIVRPADDGRAGTAEFVLTGFETPVARVELTFASGGRQRTLRRDLPPMDVASPTIHTIRVASPHEVDAVGMWLPVDAHDEDRAALLRSYSRRQLDSSWVTTERLRGSLAALEALRAAGLYAEELAWEHTPTLEIDFGADFEPSDEDSSAVLASHGVTREPPDPAALVAATGATHEVQWDTPMPPGEAHSILAVMAQEFDEASIYRLGRSYLGREIWGMDLMAPLPGSHWSQAKASAFKPTVVFSARQHANEVSSTSHVLRAAQHLLEDPDWAEALQRLNVVVHPITNPDGAQLAYDLHLITPDHMLHAGYLGSLGVDATAGAGQQDPVYPESKVRELLWNTWLPDIFLNPHGYPSHEWVQPFSEYAGWVRHRTTRSRDWWGMRGWFMPGFGYLDDPEYPRHKEHAFRIRDSITEAINGVPEIAALNERAYARYMKYGQDADPETFRTNFSDDVLIYTSLEGSRAGGRGWVERNPKVTIWSGSTEAPDETAYGEWLELVASAGLAWDQAILGYLLSLDHPVERTLSSYDDAVTIRYHRERPGTLPDTDPDAEPGPDESEPR